MQFVKGEEVKYISHLDLAKAIERTLRRGGAPVAFSEGFNPHPKIALASALRVGVTSEAEFFDVELARPMEASAFARLLTACLPPGLAVVGVAEVPLTAPALMAVANCARYTLDAAAAGDISAAAVQAALGKFMAAASIPVERETSKGKRSVDIRLLTYRIALVSLDGEQLRLEADLGLGPAGTGRPEEIIRVLAEQFGLPIETQACRIHRTGLFHRTPDGKLLSLWETLDR